MKLMVQASTNRRVINEKAQDIVCRFVKNKSFIIKNLTINKIEKVKRNSFF